MTRYQSTVNVPSALKPFIEAIREVAYPKEISLDSERIVVEFESDTEYDLAVTVMELIQTLNTLGIQYEPFDIPQPVPPTVDGAR